MKISFYRSEVNYKNELYKSPFLSVTIPNEVPRDQAVAAAIRHFQDAMKVGYWQDLAEFYEFEE